VIEYVEGVLVGEVGDGRVIAILGLFFEIVWKSLILLVNG
jgi:hypothetical protein